MARTPLKIEDHQKTVAGLLASMPVVERPIGDCLGLVAAADLTAPISLPPFDNSAMDGYAVRSADVVGAGARAPVELPIAGDIPAGRTDVPALLPGTTYRIMTGSPMPVGADTVVKVEETSGDATGSVRIYAPAPPGQHLRLAGEDVEGGATVLTAGTMLGPAQLGLAAAVGAGVLRVYRPPTVLVLSTGSELVEPGTPLRRGQIYESNGTMLAAAVTAAGGQAELLRFVPDDVEAFRATLEPRLNDVDLLLTSGGVSAGAYEVVKDALAGHGVDFVKVSMQPGGPQGAGRYRDTPVVTLPGNPVSALVSFEVFVRPVLRRAMGHATGERPVVSARLTTGVDSVPGTRQYRRGRYDSESGTVELVGGHGSHLLAALAGSNCLVVVPEEATALPEGTAVDVSLLYYG